jgi:hypothetical protein
MLLIEKLHHRLTNISQIYPAWLLVRQKAWREYYESDNTIGLGSHQEYDEKAAEKVDIGKTSIERGRKVKEIATGERKGPAQRL